MAENLVCPAEIAEFKRQTERDAVEEWQARLHNPFLAEKRVREAFGPILDQWLLYRGAVLTFWITQVVIDHGIFNAFLHRIGKTPTPLCVHYGKVEIDTAQHTLAECLA